MTPPLPASPTSLPHPPGNVVVIAPSWLGDAVMCLPALAALRGALPQAHVRVLARRSVAAVFAAAGLDLACDVLPPPPSLRLPPAVGGRPDLCLVFPNSFYAALLARRTGALRRLGYRRDARAWLLTDALPPPLPGALPAHESFYYLELVRRAGLIASLPAARPVRLTPDAAAVAAWSGRWGGETLVAIHAGATFGRAKCWLPERFAELARVLAAGGRRVLLIGSAAERPLAESIRAAAGAPAVENLAGETTLESLMALLSQVALVVANDSGPMHLAAALGTPVIALFGSTNEQQTYPLAEPGRLQLLKVEGVECSPCKLRDCPIDHRCMTRLPVSWVLAAAERALAVAVQPVGAGPSVGRATAAQQPQHGDKDR